MATGGFIRSFSVSARPGISLEEILSVSDNVRFIPLTELFSSRACCIALLLWILLPSLSIDDDWIFLAVADDENLD